MKRRGEVTITDKQAKPDALESFPSNRREVLQGPVLFDEPLAALLANESVRAAVARAEKDTASDEQEALSVVPRINPVAGALAVRIFSDAAPTTVFQLL